jgi:hypothetical protein
MILRQSRKPWLCILCSSVTLWILGYYTIVTELGEWIKLDFAVFDALATALLSASAAIDLLIENKRSLTQTHGLEIVTRKRGQEPPVMSQESMRRLLRSGHPTDSKTHLLKSVTVRSVSNPSLLPALVNKLKRCSRATQP